MPDRQPKARTPDAHPQIAGSIQRSPSGMRRLWSLEEFETLRALVHSLRDGIYITTPEGRVLDCNQAFLDLFGVAKVEDFATINVRDLFVDPDQRARELELLARDKAVREFEIQIRRPDGTILTVLDTSTAVTDTSTNETAYYGVLIDISDRKRAEDEVARSNSLLAATLDSTADGIVVMDLTGRHVQTYNRRFLEMWHIPAEMAQVPDSEALLRYALDQLKNPEQALQTAKATTATGEGESYDELELKDGRVFERFSMPQRLGGQPVGRVWSFRDVTARKTAEMRLVHDAFHDPLTGLPNRSLFADLLARAIGRARRRKDYQFALLFLDIDRFKVVNDSLGHLVGDQVLVNIARRLERCVRPGDTVARLGGDEFTVLLDDIVEAADTTRVADRIQRELQLPFNIQGQEVFTSASIGITLSRSGYDRPDELLRDADIAMYRAKALGKARYEVFDAEMHARAIHQLQLETDLRRALDREEFRCHYQPVLSLATGRIVGFETLVRWQHPQRGLLGPSEFIDAAEETGLIVLIGRVVLREACRQLHEWQVQFPMDTPLSIAVNVSARQFRQPDLADHIARALTAWDLPPSSLRLEITESTIIENVQAAAESLGRLRELGVRVDLDDFGTGYSSLSYLHQFEMDAIKVDRSFIGKIGEHGENSAIVRTIASLAANLSMEVIAEGVERVDQGDTLRSLGCDLVQGFLYAPPLTAEAARGMLRAQQEHDREQAAGSR